MAHNIHSKSAVSSQGSANRAVKYHYFYLFSKCIDFQTSVELACNGRHRIQYLERKLSEFQSYSIRSMLPDVIVEIPSKLKLISPGTISLFVVSPSI